MATTCRQSFLFTGNLVRLFRHGIPGPSCSGGGRRRHPVRLLATAAAAAPEIVLRPRLVVFPDPSERPETLTIPPHPALSIKAPPPRSPTSLQDDDDVTEYFIPVTRSSIVRYLLEEPTFFSEEEKLLVEQFAVALDTVVWNRFIGVHEELKRLFEPLDPSTATMITKKTGVRDSLDQEFWLLQKLSVVMERANFFRVPAHVTEWTTKHHVTTDGIMVNVDVDKYGVLQLWALGRELALAPMPWYERLARDSLARIAPKLHKRLPPHRPDKFLRRVVAATRLKGDGKLQLKAFRDIPADRLELLLPDGHTSMLVRDKAVAAMAAAGTLAGAGAALVSEVPSLPLAVALASSLLFTHTWGKHKNKRAAFLADANRTLFSKNVANNRSLLHALVDRAQSESFKEALLTYVFLLKFRPDMTSEKTRVMFTSLYQGGGIPLSDVERSVKSWAKRVFGVNVDFDASESVRLLSNLGLVVSHEDRLEAQPLSVALLSLPAPDPSLLLQSEEGDMLEGYDKDVRLDDILKDEKRFRRQGWT